MTWQNPDILRWLWSLPFVIALLVLGYQRRRRLAKIFASAAMTPRLMPRVTLTRFVIRCVLLTLGLSLILVALARPRFGTRELDISARGLDLFVLLDVSRSMDANDVAPSRLQRAKSDIKDVLDKLKGDRVGLVAFAGAAVVKVPLTNDLPFFRMILDELDTSSAPRGGSFIGDAIRKALQAMKPSADRDQVLLLITDGEDHDSNPREAAAAAAKRGVIIFTVGLGDAREGMRIPIRDETGELRYLQHDGQEIWSKLDEALLREIALATNGVFIPAGVKAYDLGLFYEQKLAELTRGDYRHQKRKRYREQYQWFLFAGIVLLLSEWALPGTGAGRAEVGSPQRPETERSMKNDKVRAS